MTTQLRALLTSVARKIRSPLGILVVYVRRLLLPLSLGVGLLPFAASAGVIWMWLGVLTAQQQAPPEVVLGVCKAFIAFWGSMAISISLANLFVIVCFLPLGMLLFAACVAIVTVASTWFITLDAKAEQNISHVARVFRRAFHRVGTAICTAYLALVTVLLIRSTEVHGFTIERLLNDGGRAMASAVPLVFCWYWTVYSVTLKRRRQRHRTSVGLEHYLFSDYSIRTSLFNSFSVTLFLLAFSWWLLPLVFDFSAFVAASLHARLLVICPDYERMREAAEQYLVLHTSSSWEDFMPSYAHLGSRLNPGDGLFSAVCPQYGRTILMKYLLLCTALCSLLSVVCPVFLRATISGDFRPFVRRLVVAAVKTTTLSILLKAAISHGFLVSFGSNDIIGKGTLVTYMLAMLLAFAKDPPPRSVPARDEGTPSPR